MIDPVQLKTEANPLIWGAVLAIAVSLMLALGNLIGQPASDNALLQRPVSAAAVSFFWGWAAASFKNWLGRRYR